MRKYQFTITMTVPLGTRRGFMELQETGGLIIGQMHILGRDTSFSGSLFPDNRCELTGNMTLLTRSFAYRAAGTLTEQNIDLKLYGERNRLHITGEAKNDENIL